MDIERTLRDVANSYPIAWLVANRIKDIPRVAFQIRLALNGTAPSNVSVCDIGGGVGLFSIGCAALGMKVVVIDDFEEHRWYWNDGGADLHERYGVSVICRDVIKVGVSDIDEHFDIVTTFDTMEHWHHSPKALFRQICGGLLKPGGRFVLGVPNCVNFRKRITTPLGYNKWSGMDVWYEQEVFRGHVREPDVDDLRYIARDMKLSDVKISGRNWLGYRSRFKPIRVLTPLADHALRLFPSLCSDLYLTGTVYVAAKPDRLQQQHASATEIRHFRWKMPEIDLQVLKISDASSVISKQRRGRKVTNRDMQHREVPECAARHHCFDSGPDTRVAPGRR